MILCVYFYADFKRNEIRNIQKRFSFATPNIDKILKVFMDAERAIIRNSDDVDGIWNSINKSEKKSLKAIA